MSDQYPRVTFDREQTGSYRWFEPVAMAGTHKVVPADAIVIERGEVPAVEDVAFMRRLEAGGTFADYGSAPGYYRRTGAAYLALAEHLDAHPPVDEAQAEALFHDLAVRFTPNDDLLDFARRMVAEGWTKPEPTP